MSRVPENNHGEVDAKATSGEMAEERVRVRSSRRTPLLIAALVLAVAAGGVTWWFSRPRGTGAGRPVPTPRTATLSEPSGAGETQAEERLTLTPEVLARAGIKVEPVGEQLTEEGSGALATGVVQPNAYRMSPVVSLVGGVVRSVGAELGRHVERGEHLVVIFSDELSTAQSKYLTALAELDEHHKRHRRSEELLEIGAASREELEQSATKVKSTEAEVASLRQRLLFLGLSLKQVEALRSSSEITSEVSLPAPVSGTVIGRSVNPGEVVEANKELLRVADLSSVWVMTQVYEKDLSRVRVGSGAGITTSAYPGRVFRGRVTYVDPTIEQATRTAQARVEVENPGRALKIGMYVNVALGPTTGGPKAAGTSVPAAAVQQIGNRQVVFVATGDPSVFALRRVRLGPEANGRYLVLEGLNVGERVVTEGSFLLRTEWAKLHPGAQ